MASHKLSSLTERTITPAALMANNRRKMVLRACMPQVIEQVGLAADKRSEQRWGAYPQAEMDRRTQARIDDGWPNESDYLGD